VMVLLEIPVNRRLALLCLLLLAGGCGGSGNGTAQPTASSLKQFTDPTLKFSFSHLPSWVVGKGTQVQNPTGSTTYTLPINTPGQLAQAQISVDRPGTPLPAFKDGLTTHEPSGAANAYFHYYHRTMSGLPAMRVELWVGATLSEVDTFADTSTSQYDVRILEGAQPLTATILGQYADIVSSMKIPFS
jgi:hypothetical protein